MQTHPSVPWVQFTRLPDGIAIACTVCQQNARGLSPAAADQFAGLHAAHQSGAVGYLGAGDAVAAVTSKLGIKPCTPCEARRRMLNQMLPRVWPRRA